MMKNLVEIGPHVFEIRKTDRHRERETDRRGNFIYIDVEITPLSPYV